MTLVSCEFNEFNNSQNKSPIVINSFFTSDSSIFINVSKVCPVSDSLPVIVDVDSAEVSLFTDGSLISNLIKLPLNSDGVSGNSKSMFYAKDLDFDYNKNYTVRVRLQDNSIIESTDYIPTPVSIESVDTLVLYDKYSNTPLLLRCRLRLHDPGGEKNYYSISGFQRRSSSYDGRMERKSVIISSNDPMLEGAIVRGFYKFYYFSDELINGTDASISFDLFPDCYVSDTDFVDIELNSISENYYRYSKSLAAYYEDNPDMYSEPVEVFSNVENGYGIFAGYSRSVVRLNMLAVDSLYHIK